MCYTFINTNIKDIVMDNNTNFDKLYDLFYNTTQLPETNDPIDGYSEMDDLDRIARKRALRQIAINQRRKQTIQQARNSKRSMQNASGLSGQLLKMENPGNSNIFGTTKPTPRSVAATRMLKKAKAKPNHSWLFGVKDR
jgi:hypothetical protein